MAVPITEYSRPSSVPSVSTDRWTCDLLAPMVRSRARVRRRCVTSTRNVLAITRAATNMASTPNARIAAVTGLMPPPFISLSRSSAASDRLLTWAPVSFAFTAFRTSEAFAPLATE